MLVQSFDDSAIQQQQQQQLRHVGFTCRHTLQSGSQKAAGEAAGADNAKL